MLPDMMTLDNSVIEELIVRIRENSGFDFSGYSRPSLLRRTESYLHKHGIGLEELISYVGQGSREASGFAQDLTVNYTEMFRDPDFYKLLKSAVFSYLESYAELRFWVAGCASGEEAFSLAIMLRECSLKDRSLIYGTDINQKVLAIARDGAYHVSAMRSFSENYLQAGGKTSLSDYYHVSYGKAAIDPEIRKQIIFASHDLTGDGIFNEFQFISCRNVLIYFTLEQRKKIFRKLYDSLAPLGFLCLGKRETLRDSGLQDCFRVVSEPLNIYQRIV
ncbi:CheR family methyltransferase [Dyadobacter luteus]|jgi:chemotaxis protein methyltransferase CheR|nr:CheR family methyltransferase [Dyadobacter luteus]